MKSSPAGARDTHAVRERTTLVERLARVGDGWIDVHTHVIDPRLDTIGATLTGRFPTVRQRDPQTLEVLLDGEVYRVVDDRCWSAPARLRDMAAEGIAAQVVSPMPITLCHDQPASGAVEFAKLQNDLLVDFVDAAPDRFFALGSVPLQDPKAAVAELHRCIDELGFAGVEISTTVGDSELTDSRFRPFFEAAGRLGAVVFLHPVDAVLDSRYAKLGIGFGMGMPTETATAAAGILTSDLVDLFPQLRLLLAHGGGALPAVLPRVAAGQRIVGGERDPAKLATTTARHLWSDSLTYDPESLQLAAERFGAEHLVLGTDYPFAARETPAGAVLSQLPQHCGCCHSQTLHASKIARDNVLTLLSGVHRSTSCVSL